MDHLPLYLIFVTFAPLWWLLIAGATLLVIYGLDEDNGSLATGTVVASLVALALFSDMGIIPWIVAHPLNLLIYIGLYFVGGGLWGLVKWYFFAANRRDKYDDEKREWLKAKGASGPEVPDGLKDEWKKYLLGCHEWSEDTGEWTPEPERLPNEDYDTYERRCRGVRREKIRRLKLVPIAWENKSLILTWMTYWPWSLFWTVSNDFVRKAFKRIQRALSDLMDRIARFVFRDTEKDFKPEEKAKV